MPRDVRIKVGFEKDSREIVVKVDDLRAEPWSLGQELRVVGTRVSRINAKEVVTGTARFTSDVQLAGMLHARIVRCPYGGATVRSIDAKEAESLSGVVRVLKHEGRACLYAGDEVAVVVAETPEIAEDAASRVRVEYEVRQPVVTIEDAMAEGAPQVFAGQRNYEVRKARGLDRVEEALKGAAAVLEKTYRTQVQDHIALEPHGAVAHVQPDRVEAWVSTQSCQGAAAELGTTMGIQRGKVQVHCEYVGGGFGGKFGLTRPGKLAAELSRDLGAPVRLVYARDEEHTNGGCRPGSLQTIRAGVRGDGKIVAWHVKAYGTAGIGRGGGVHNPMIYDLGATAKEFANVYTNQGEGQPFRAPGHPQGSFAIESMIDELAEAIGMDPLEMRKKNTKSAVRREQFDLGAKRIGWERRKDLPGKGTIRRGLGMAAARWGALGAPGSSIEISLNRDGTVEIQSGAQDIGTGTRTLLAVLAAEELGLRPDEIVVRIGDSSLAPGLASGGSMTGPSLGPAARDAAFRLGVALKELAAAELGVPAGELLLSDGQLIHSRDASRRISLARVASRMPQDKLTARADRAGNFSVYEDECAGAQFAEVEVDTETGIVRVLKIVAIQDCGRIVNRLTAESQVAGGVIQGISYALFEERILDRRTGGMVNPDMLFYKMCGSMDVPEIEVILFELNNGGNNVGMMGLGEPPKVPTAGAIANAVAHAIGARIRELPITPWRVLEAMAREKK